MRMILTTFEDIAVLPSHITVRGETPGSVSLLPRIATEVVRDSKWSWKKYIGQYEH